MRPVSSRTLSSVVRGSASLDLEVRDRVARRVGVGRHPRAHAPVPADRRLDRPGARRRAALDERDVLARDLPRLQCSSGGSMVGAYLITTPVGHILLDGGMPSSAKDIEASIRKLGFKPEDIRILLITHAHVDHAGTTAYFKRMSDAQVAVMARDVDILRSGGKTDPAYATMPAFYFPPVKADRVLKDGDTVTLGNVTLTARLTAGHTPGCTTWITSVVVGGTHYSVVFPGSSHVNPGMQLVVNPSYQGIADDFRKTFAVLASVKPDIWLGAHTESFNFDEKRARASEGAAAWIDPEGYRTYVAKEQAEFEAQLRNEQTDSSHPGLK